MSKTFLVTGAASGIGLELARQLLLRGDKVCACDVNVAGMQPLQVLAGNGQLRTEALDVRDPAAWNRVVDALVADWGRLDVLANVAGVLRDNWVQDATPDDVHFHFDINVKGTIFGMQSVLRHMLPRGQGHIINIASLAGLSPVPGLGLYSASKFAVRGYSLAAGMELAEKGIAVTAICPDAVQTPMLDIQKGKEQAALTFSGLRALSTEEVVAAILGPALTQRPLEITLPAWRGGVSKLAGIFPESSARVVGIFRKAGLKRQQALRDGKDSTQR
jgi:3-oxoacyl-[acyl-carrier protein] reductase